MRGLKRVGIMWLGIILGGFGGAEKWSERVRIMWWGIIPKTMMVPTIIRIKWFDHNHLVGVGMHRHELAES